MQLLHNCAFASGSLNSPQGGGSQHMDQKQTPRKQAGRKRKRVRGERKKKEAGDLLTRLVGVRLTEAEYQELAGQAQLTHLLLGAQLRATWRGTPAGEGPPRAWTVDELAIYKQMGGLANNLNQLARKCNQGQLLTQQPHQLYEQLQTLLDALVQPG